MKVKVLRPFLIQGEPVEAGAEIDITDRQLLAMMLHAGKVQAIEAQPETGPMTTETASGIVQGAAETSSEEKPAKARK